MAVQGDVSGTFRIADKGPRKKEERFIHHEGIGDRAMLESCRRLRWRKSRCRVKAVSGERPSRIQGSKDKI